MKISEVTQKFYSISELAESTGVSSITLRAWERRYALLAPQRSRMGHRLYCYNDVEKIKRVVHYINQGVTVSKVQQLLAIEHTELETDIWLEYIGKIIEVIKRYDQKSLNDIYDLILSLHPIEIITKSLFVPLLRYFGTQWELKYAGAIAEERFFSNFLRLKLGMLFNQLAIKAKGKKLLFACLPDEQHEFGLWLFALYMMERGYQVIYLGFDLPVEDIFVAAQRMEAEAIVLVGTITDKIKLTLRRAQKITQAVVFAFMRTPSKVRTPFLIQLVADYSASFKIIQQQLK